MATNQSRLTPEQQKLAFLLSQQSGKQPTSGGLAPTTPDPVAQMGTGQLDSDSFQALFGQQQQPQEAPQMPAPGSFRNDPQGAMQHIGQMLTRNSAGVLQAPSTNPLLKLFGVKTDVNSPNYYNSVKEAGLDKFIPGELYKTPEGTPFVGARSFEAAVKAATTSGKLGNDKPSKELGSLALTRMERLYGKDSPEYQNAKTYISNAGGLPLSKLGDWTSATAPTKENDFVKSPDGLMLRYNRIRDTYEPVPGQSTGTMSVLGNPINLQVFNSSRQRFDSDPVVKGNKQALDLLGNASAILESNNPASIGVLFSNIAKSVGKEAGVLTEGDISRAVGDPGWGAQLARWYEKRADIFNGKGQLTEKDLKDFRGLFRDISSAAYSRYNAAVDKHVRSTAKTIPGLSEDFIRSAFDTAVPFMEATNRRLPGKATNYPDQTQKPTSDPLGLF